MVAYDHPKLREAGGDHGIVAHRRDLAFVQAQVAGDASAAEAHVLADDRIAEVRHVRPHRTREDRSLYFRAVSHHAPFADTGPAHERIVADNRAVPDGAGADNRCMWEDAHVFADDHVSLHHCGLVDLRGGINGLFFDLPEHEREQVQQVPRVLHRLPETFVRHRLVLLRLEQGLQRPLVAVVTLACDCLERGEERRRVVMHVRDDVHQFARLISFARLLYDASDATCFDAQVPAREIAFHLPCEDRAVHPLHGGLLLEGFERAHLNHVVPGHDQSRLVLHLGQRTEARALHAEVQIFLLDLREAGEELLDLFLIMRTDDESDVCDASR